MTPSCALSLPVNMTCESAQRGRSAVVRSSRHRTWTREHRYFAHEHDRGLWDLHPPPLPPHTSFTPTPPVINTCQALAVTRKQDRARAAPFRRSNGFLIVCFERAAASSAALLRFPPPSVAQPVMTSSLILSSTHFTRGVDGSEHVSSIT